MNMRVDVDLTGRLERAYGASAARYARRLASEQPGCGARVLEMREGVVVVDSGAGGGENAHCAYGLAIKGASDDDIARIERFYGERDGAAVRVMATPPVHASLHMVLARRGFVVSKQSSLLVTSPFTIEVAGDVRPLDESDIDGVLDVMAACYGPNDRDLGRARALPLFRAPTTMFGAFKDGALAACGALVVEEQERVGLLFAGMCRPESRGRGLQTALIHARVAHAHTLGLNLVTSLTEPASTSERNLRRAGFVVACTQSVWSLHGPREKSAGG